MKKLIIILLASSLCQIYASNYYVSPTGNDANDGTLSSPKYNISSVVNVLTPGDTVFVLPGLYNYNHTIKLKRAGTSDQRICIFGIGYESAAERPLLNFSSQGVGDSNRAFVLEKDADFWHIKGLIVQEAGDNGIKIESNWNIIEFCDFNACYDSGVQIGLSKNSEKNDGSCAYNYILNCDSYNNCDSHKSGGNADGFACKLFCGPGNVFENCRSWNNSDDGWDMYSNTFGVLLLNCWTWHNGDKNTLRANKYGNGNGFKMGGNSTYSRGTNIAVGCIGFDLHYVSGAGKVFDQNDNQDPQVMLHCVAFDNIKGYSMASGSSGHIIKNCIGFNSRDKIISDQDQNITENNSWQFGSNTKDKKNGGIANYDDFIIDLSDNQTANQLASVQRDKHGVIPDNGFCRLKSASDCIDKGQTVSYTFLTQTNNLSFWGSAPDLGAFEYNPLSSTVNQLHSETLQLKIYKTTIAGISKIDFQLDKSASVSIGITDLNGRIVQKPVENLLFPAGKNFQFVYLENLPKGIYLATVSIDNSKVQTLKFQL